MEKYFCVNLQTYFFVSIFLQFMNKKYINVLTKGYTNSSASSPMFKMYRFILVHQFRWKIVQYVTTTESEFGHTEPFFC